MGGDLRRMGEPQSSGPQDIATGRVVTGSGVWSGWLRAPAESRVEAGECGFARRMYRRVPEVGDSGLCHLARVVMVVRAFR